MHLMHIFFFYFISEGLKNMCFHVISMVFDLNPLDFNGFQWILMGFH